ncbi:MAG: hypothetical protein WDN25_25580 [Acetobacteraceae bacterium]
MQAEPAPGTGALTRSVSQWERALLAQWFAAINRNGAAAIAAAYVSERSLDDPKLRNMIVIAERSKAEVSFLIHRPQGENAWVLTCGQTSTELGRFRTLPEALNTIRPPRPPGSATDGAGRAEQIALRMP